MSIATGPLEEEIDRLQGEVEKWKRKWTDLECEKAACCVDNEEGRKTAEAECQRLADRVLELEEALRPFAECGELTDEDLGWTEDVMRARRLLGLEVDRG